MGQRLAQHVGVSGAAAQTSADALATQHKEKVLAAQRVADTSAAEALEPYAVGEAARAGRLPGYAGPMELEPTAAAAMQKQAAYAQEAARMATTPAGRATLLAKLYNAPQSTAGGSMLDSALAGQGAAKQLGAIGARYGTLSQYAQRTADEARSISEKAKQGVDANIERLKGMQAPSAPATIGAAAPATGGRLTQGARKEKDVDPLATFRWAGRNL